VGHIFFVPRDSFQLAHQHLLYLLMDVSYSTSRAATTEARPPLVAAAPKKLKKS
jgi:hypothetical protein